MFFFFVTHNYGPEGQWKKLNVSLGSVDFLRKQLWPWLTSSICRFLVDQQQYRFGRWVGTVKYFVASCNIHSKYEWDCINLPLLHWFSYSDWVCAVGHTSWYSGLSCCVTSGFERSQPLCFGSSSLLMHAEGQQGTARVPAPASHGRHLCAVPCSWLWAGPSPRCWIRLVKWSSGWKLCLCVSAF